MKDDDKNPLGKHTQYDSPYDAGLLFPLDRKVNRELLNLSASLPFHGEDIWTSYELSWLEMSGKPQVAIAFFRFPADSPRMIESKSFKLYLNSLNQKHFDNEEALRHLLVKDLSEVAGATISVDIILLGGSDQQPEPLQGNVGYKKAVCIDDLPVSDFEYQPDAGLLRRDTGAIDSNAMRVEEYLYSDLLRSNCPVTGQPDWGSVYIRYQGKKISHESLLRYVVSFRQHQDFHENCVERIFVDIMSACKCQSLSVYARYARRGGLDINPYRATLDYPTRAGMFRTIRQ